MPRVFLPNFDFEHQLAEPSRADFGEAVRQINAELACVWLAVAEPGDAVWSPAGKPIFKSVGWPPSAVQDGLFSPAGTWTAEGGHPTAASAIRWITDDSQLARGDELCPWGWSEQVVTWGKWRGLTCPAPPRDAVREVNSRRFSVELEQTLGVNTAGAKLISSPDELAEALQSIASSQRWMLKGLFGMSGRERLVGRGLDLTPPMLGWLRERLARDGAVIFEPWLDRIAEAGIQWHIPQHGEPVFVGVAPMISPLNSSGAYVGSRIEPCEFLQSPGGGEGGDSLDSNSLTELLWHEAIDVTARVANEAQRRGYFGPLGIDAMLYCDAEGQTRLRPIQDVNARWTMGRLALELRRFLKPHEFGSWLHLNWNVRESASARERRQPASSRLPSDVRVLWTSPIEIGGSVPRKQTALLIAPDAETRAAAESALIQIVSENG